MRPINKKVIIHTITDEASKRDAEDVIIGKLYDVLYDEAFGEYFFIDEAGDKNYGCDDASNSVYEFEIIEGDA